MTLNSAGNKINSQTLFQQQKAQPAIAPGIIADNLRSPENIASLFRLADASGAKQIIFIQDNKQIFHLNKNIRRFSRNTCKRVDVIYCSIDEFKERLTRLPPLIALELTDTATSVLSTNLAKDCYFVVGSERFGISDDLLQLCQSAVRVPMFGHNGSMNVSHALAICLFEWHRQHPTIQPQLSTITKDTGD